MASFFNEKILDTREVFEMAQKVSELEKQVGAFQERISSQNFLQKTSCEDLKLAIVTLTALKGDFERIVNQDASNLEPSEGNVQANINR